MITLRTVKSGSSGNGYVIRAGNESLILEAGVPLIDMKKALDFDVKSVQGCLITHIHGDHIKYAKEYARAGIKAYTNFETADKYGHGLLALVEKRPHRIGNFKVIPFHVPHVSVGEDGVLENCMNYAYIIEHEYFGKLLYATDFEYLPYKFESFRLNHFLIECNHIDRLIDKESPNFEHVVRGHSSLETVVKIIEINRTTDLNTVTLCHLSNQNADAEEMILQVSKAAGAGVRVNIAEPGKDISLAEIPFME